MFIDMNHVWDILHQHGMTGLGAILEHARQTVISGSEVVVGFEYDNAPRDTERTIKSLPELETWRKEITPIYFKLFRCPQCSELLKHMGNSPNQAYRRFKCYDPPGCGSIYRLSKDFPARLMLFDPNGGPERSYPASEM